MPVNVGPKQAKDSLIFSFDAANYKSYAGSGLTIFGLSSSIGATLLNGVGFGSTNNGYFIFDGTNDYINAANPAELQITTGTICVWCKTSAPGASYRGIVAKQFGYGIFYVDGYLTVYDWLVPRGNITNYNLADGNWKHIAFSFQSGVNNGSTLYLNAVGILTTTYTISNNLSNLFVGSEANSSQHSNCSISQVFIYNRVLTAQEILQNYNATKGRYI